MGQLFFCGAAGNKLTHDAADHIQVDIQHDLFQFFLMIGTISLGTQQTTLLTTSPDKAHAVAMRMLC